MSQLKPKSPEQYKYWNSLSY